MFDRVLVANRGEIAVRVMRAAAELDVETVAVYSDADRDAGHVRYADEAHNVGPARAADSYLDGRGIVEVAREAGADAIHPGYGFLAENADFAARVEGVDGIVWVGPSSEAMRRLGEKTRARQVMTEADVPVVPGTTEPVESAERVRELGEEFGYPIAIKAAAGGGGRGMKVVEGPEEVDAALESARREGEAYFDDPAVYVEKYLEAPRHVEVQILADEHGNVRHLGERDCSLQRRHQKVIEEAPSPALDEDLRERIGAAARRGVDAAGYTNAGTVEFLVPSGAADGSAGACDGGAGAAGDEADPGFYFMEVNTRIQVEHTVTEAVTGIDVLKWQLRIAAGQRIDFPQADVEPRGHAVEYRINAENPAEGFAPTPGTLSTYDPPGGIGIRVDDGVRQGDAVSGEYDSMIGKLIVHAGDRRECLARSRRALAEFDVEGVHTTIPFHRLMLEDDVFLAGAHHTAYLDDSVTEARLAEAVERWGPASAGAAPDGAVRERTFTVEVDGKRFEVDVAERDPPERRGSTSPGAGRREAATADPAGDDRSADETGDSEDVDVPAGGETVVAEMQGTILDVPIAEGDVLEPGDVVCVLEAMKMENDVVTGRGGTVAAVPIEVGQAVDTGDTLVVLE